MTTPSGELDRRIRLQQPVITRDPSYGSQATAWQTVATLWARLRERMAAEATEAAPQRTLQRQITVRIRWRADVRSTWRIEMGAGASVRVLQINGSIEVGRREWLDLDCEEITGGA